jgi:diguanylate cyclase (GGDEF)-like protein
VQLNLVRNILAGFLVVAVSLVFTALLALYLLGQTADVLDHRSKESPPVAQQSVDAGAVSDSGLSEASARLRQGQVLILLVGLAGLMIGLAGVVVAANQASRILSRLKQATRQLTNVVLDEELPDSAVATADDLENEIRDMMRKIKASQQLWLDASPLTRLPGNIAIEQVLKGKMSHHEKFALCYIDLDDFKAYNDKYGYAKGSELIKLTGEIIHRAKNDYADPEDFVGHIGGDDFVLITSPAKVESVCQSILSDFDKVIPDHYDEVDRERGYIEGDDRYGVHRRFSLMSISIAVVSDAQREFSSPIEIAQVATEIKDYVKTLPGSNYLIDRRVSTRWGG